MGVSSGPSFPLTGRGKGQGRAQKSYCRVLLGHIVFSLTQRETNYKVVSLQELQVISVILCAASRLTFQSEPLLFDSPAPEMESSSTKEQEGELITKFSISSPLASVFLRLHLRQLFYKSSCAE